MSAITQRLPGALAAALLLTSALASAQSVAGDPLIDPLRWDIEGSFKTALGVPKSVAIGDDGALTVVGRSWTDSGVDFHASGSADALREVRFADTSFLVRVDAADHAPVAAVFTMFDIDPKSDVYLFEPRITLYDATDDITEEWSWAFAPDFYWYEKGGGVAVSDDGQVVLGWWDSADRQLARFAALRRDGSLISTLDLPMVASGQEAGGPSLSDDGSRAVVTGHANFAYLLDLQAGAVLDSYKTPTGTPLGGIAISGDGQRYVTSTWTELNVWEETVPGTWTKILSLPQVGDERFGPVALSQDGSRLGYSIQYRNPFDTIEVVLLEVDSQKEFFRTLYTEPGTFVALKVFDLELDDAGRVLACASLGDSQHATPEVFLYDDTGSLLSEYYLPGSAVDIDLDPRGEVVVFGSEIAYGGHRTIAGRVSVADPSAPELRVAGTPSLGGKLELTLAGGRQGSWVYLLASPALGSTSTPFGDLALDMRAQGAFRVGSWSLASGGVRKNFPIGSGSELAGLRLHFQGIILDGGAGHVTNKVSVRFVP